MAFVAPKEHPRGGSVAKMGDMGCACGHACTENHRRVAGRGQARTPARGWVGAWGAVHATHSDLPGVSDWHSGAVLTNRTNFRKFVLTNCQFGTGCAVLTHIFGRTKSVPSAVPKFFSNFFNTHETPVRQGFAADWPGPKKSRKSGWHGVLAPDLQLPGCRKTDKALATASFS